jgi:hypothetical protein
MKICDYALQENRSPHLELTTVNSIQAKPGRFLLVLSYFNFYINQVGSTFTLDD